VRHRKFAQQKSRPTGGLSILDLLIADQINRDGLPGVSTVVDTSSAAAGSPPRHAGG
jgi:hypothetical protein